VPSKRRLVRIATFKRQLAYGAVGVPEPVAGPTDPKPRQILAGGEAEQRPNPLIELEWREAGVRCEFRDAQGLVEMIVDIGEGR